MASTVSTVRVSSRAALAFAVALLVPGIIGLSGQAFAFQDPSPGHPAADALKIEGTWRVQITPIHCQTGAPVALMFPALATFGREGTVLTADGSSSPSARSAGHGVWSATGHGLYEAFTEAFLYTDGLRTGVQQIRQRIQVGAGGREFTASVTGRVLGLDGTVLLVRCATSAGQRME